jgi:hypothetical protein
VVANPLLAFALLLAAAGPVPGVPAPPGGRFETEITGIVSARAEAQMKPFLDQLEKDTTQSAAAKEAIRKKAARLTVAVYSSPGSIDELALFYMGKIRGAEFTYADRDIAVDLLETLQAGGLSLPPAAIKAWEGKKGRSARWSRPDGSLEIDIEDHLIDPRDGRVTKQTVVMITATP